MYDVRESSFCFNKVKWIFKIGNWYRTKMQLDIMYKNLLVGRKSTLKILSAPNVKIQRYHYIDKNPIAVYNVYYHVVSKCFRILSKLQMFPYNTQYP